MPSRSVRYARPAAGAVRTPSARVSSSKAGTGTIPSVAPRPRPVRHCARRWARSLFVLRDFRLGFVLRQTLRPHLGIGRHGAILLTVLRLRVGLRYRIISRTGRRHEPGKPFEIRGCLTPPRDRRGALEERRRPFGDQFRVKRPVSEGRMSLLAPFETKE